MRRKIFVFLALMLLGTIAIPFAVVGTDTREYGGAKEKVRLRVYLHEEDRIEEMDMEEYLVGVLAAEMPAEFQPEALMAQATAARTYAAQHMKSLGGSGVPGHPNADISTDHRVHQAWMSEAAMREKWGSAYDRYHAKLTRAVADSAGQVIVYQGRLIRALYHAMSGEKTADAMEVWGTDQPYLRSVPCRWDRELPRYREERVVTLAEAASALGSEIDAAPVMGSGAEVVRVVNRTESGRADLVRIGGKNFAGEEVRTKLGLRSTNFTAALKDGMLCFTTLGYGHGVGLCQYGANGMAKEGYSCEEILTHYYTGVEIVPLSSLKRS